jgi:hypothetical protein
MGTECEARRSSAPILRLLAELTVITVQTRLIIILSKGKMMSIDCAGGSLRNAQEFVLPARWAQGHGFQIKIGADQIFLVGFLVLGALVSMAHNCFAVSICCRLSMQISRCVISRVFSQLGGLWQQQPEYSHYDQDLEKCKSRTALSRPTHDHNPLHFGDSISCESLRQAPQALACHQSLAVKHHQSLLKVRTCGLRNIARGAVGQRHGETV